MLISTFLFSGETEAEELTTKCLHDPSECFQREVVTLMRGRGGKSRCSWSDAYGCWQNPMWKLFVLPWCFNRSLKLSSSPLPICLGTSRDLSFESLFGNLLILPHSAQSICWAVWKDREQSPSFSLTPYPLACAASLKALDLKSSCTRETRHPLLGHSLEQRVLCLRSIGNIHSSWEQPKSLFKDSLLKSSTWQQKTIWCTKITP